MNWPEDRSIELTGPLAGVRVLDLTRIIAGPLCTLYLADLGADVIKVERPTTGDEMRGYGPAKVDGVGSTFLALNRNKRSIVLDLDKEGDRESLRHLASSAHVVVESFRPGVVERWGIAFDQLKVPNPGIVYCSITGFGSEGPLAHHGANNLIAAAFGGVLSVTASDVSSGLLSRGPAMTDFFTGSNAAMSILAALYGRSGHGDAPVHIELSLMEAQALAMSGYIVGYLGTGEVPSSSAGLPFTVPNQPFNTADKPMVLAINSEDMWSRMCIAISKPEWLESPAFKSNASRMMHQDEIVDEVGTILLTRKRTDWLSVFGNAGVTAAPINDVADFVNHPQVSESRLLLRHSNEDGQSVQTVRLPFRYNDHSWNDAAHRPPPRLGQHTESILAGLGGS